MTASRKESTTSIHQKSLSRNNDWTSHSNSSDLTIQWTWTLGGVELMKAVQMAGFMLDVHEADEDIDESLTKSNHPSIQFKAAGTKMKIDTNLTRSEGFHPIFKSTISFTKIDQDLKDFSLIDCDLAMVYLNLPPSIIIDRYQVHSLFHQSQLINTNITNQKRPNRSLIQDLLISSNPDLEAPLSLVDSDWTGQLLIPLLRNLSFQDDQLIQVSVPFHLRYLPPLKIKSHDKNYLKEKVNIQPPSLVMVCNQN
ncbi:hypothetical protein O181_045843, partial [Austropuccinia psidii MF-1]|nr:hypothetical protein [Austropuccinia psidii MF-1]